ncbi:MAG: hypothetical protein Fues2KO_04650 [Fuerstiella sp.]
MTADLTELLERDAPFTARTRGGTKKSETEPADDYQAFSHGRIGRRPQMMIAFRRCNGETLVFPYASLLSIVSADPDTGFKLRFVEAQITITGQHLTRLFHTICEHRVLDIVEADRTAQLLATEDTIVQRLEILTKTPPVAAEIRENARRPE